ncbi:MAG: hypothetical protein COS95_06150 [Ignavibacteriales bacterium CG07_land_8_20_14_0_80_59_12]|nr:MAG: hypothetical protein COS95_06150 [Ignavibacteriales bacterium CG07_land_8_20_14_0_80_59_12]
MYREIGGSKPNMAASELIRALVRERVTLLSHIKNLEARVAALKERSTEKHLRDLSELLRFFAGPFRTQLTREAALLSMLAAETQSVHEVPDFLASEEEALVREAQELIAAAERFGENHPDEDPARSFSLGVAAFVLHLTMHIGMQDNILFTLLQRNLAQLPPHVLIPPPPCSLPDEP